MFDFFFGLLSWFTMMLALVAVIALWLIIFGIVAMEIHALVKERINKVREY